MYHHHNINNNVQRKISCLKKFFPFQHANAKKRKDNDPKCFNNFSNMCTKKAHTHTQRLFGQNFILYCMCVSGTDFCIHFYHVLMC